MHRKLFPAATATNQTQECLDFCDPPCPYNCYSYPDNYFPPPPPPISPPSNQISAYLAIVASLFTVAFVLVGVYVLKVKCYSDWCGRRRNNGSFSTQSYSLEDENQVDHPIWLMITTVGLQQSLINSITICKYKKGEGPTEGTECSVCLNEFNEEENLRVLPKCNHAFHIPCIDTWLQSHINCPLCRAPIVPNNANSDAATINMSSVEENSNTLAVRHEDVQVEQHNDSESIEEASEIGEAQKFTHESISKDDQNEQIVDEIKQGTDSASMVTSVDHINGDDERCKVKSERGCSAARCLHVSPVSMKRSGASCNGRIVSARGYKGLNSSPCDS